MLKIAETTLSDNPQPFGGCAPPLEPSEQQIAYRKRLEWRERVRDVCWAHEVDWEDVFGESLSRHVTEARQHAYSVMRECGLSFPRIGELFNRHHASVIFGVRAHRKRHGTS